MTGYVCATSHAQSASAIAEAEWRSQPFRFLAARVEHRSPITTALPAGTALAPRFERRLFRAGLAGEGTNIDIRQL
jgi:hypothetical protein